MRMERTAILVVSLLLATTTVALAATWQTGSYVGHTKALYCVKFKNGTCDKFANGRVSFRVNATTIGAAAKAKHGQIKFQVREKCADNSFSNWPVRINGEGPIDSNGKFSSSIKTAKGTGKNQFKGTVSGSKAAGKLRRYDKEDQMGRENKNGVKCDSGWVKWSAKLQ